VGSCSHEPQGNALSDNAPTGVSEQRPLAPAPLPALAGVVALVVGASLAVTRLVANDWVAVFAFFAALALGAVVLNRLGRERAERQPHPLYRADRLPADRSSGRVRFAAALVTLVALVVYVTATARPDEYGSPFPYFLAGTLLYLVVPQLSSRWLVWKYDRQNSAED
jgi:hypothetical protein